jgi:hypothetical protein
LQIHKVPSEAISPQGVQLIAAKIAAPISYVREGFMSRTKCLKVKINLPIAQPLEDKIKIAQPTPGEFRVYFVFERIN